VSCPSQDAVLKCKAEMMKLNFFCFNCSAFSLPLRPNPPPPDVFCKMLRAFKDLH